MLIATGEDVNAMDMTGESALRLAVGPELEGMVMLLLEGGARVDL